MTSNVANACQISSTSPIPTNFRSEPPTRVNIIPLLFRQSRPSMVPITALVDASCEPPTRPNRQTKRQEATFGLAEAALAELAPTKASNPLLIKKYVDSIKISKGIISQTGISKFESSKVSQAVRWRRKCPGYSQKGPPMAGLWELASCLQTPIWDICSANLAIVSGSRLKNSRFREIEAGDRVRCHCRVE